MRQRTWIELSKKAFEHNIAQIQPLMGNALLGFVIKANAYGHGMYEMAQLAEAHPAIQWLFVASTREALELRRKGITKPLLAMSYLDSDKEAIIDYGIACAVYEYETAYYLNNAALRKGKIARVHIKIDSNMFRLGTLPALFTQFCVELMQLSGLSVEGVFTHLCDTNNVDTTFTEEQLRIFDAVIAGNPWACKIPYKHVIASGSLLWHKKYDIIRAGTNLYGFWKSSIQQEQFRMHVPFMELSPLLTWKARILHIKIIKRKENVQKLAVIPVGYYDGYPRINSGFVLIKDFLAPLVDMVTINIMIVDVTSVPEVQVDDEVVLIGNQSGVTATDVADRAGTINNEIVTRIHGAIPRKVVD